MKEFFKKRKEEILKNKLPGIYTNRWYTPLKIILIITGIINIILGTYITILYSNLYSIKIPYNNKKIINFNLNRNLKNIFFYIEIDDFYQNHLLYSSDICFSQLLENDMKCCNESNNVIYPCGVVGNTYLRDEFKIDGVNIRVDNINLDSEKGKIKGLVDKNILEDQNISEVEIDENGNILKINDKNMNLNEKLNVKKNYDGNLKITKPELWDELDLKLNNDPRFLNWINISAFTPFRKLYGRIDNMDAGNYLIEIDQKFFFGKKYIYLAESSWIGTKNYFFSLFLIISGFLSLLTGLILIKNL